jgi:hypothetical protein
MLLPSRQLKAASARPWSIPRALAYGAVIGMLAATVKSFGLARDSVAAHGGSLAEIAGAAVGFALLCAGAAAARNFLARRLIWRDAE